MVCTTTNSELLGALEPLFITFLLIKAQQNLLVLSSVSGEEKEEKQSGWASSRWGWAGLISQLKAWTEVVCWPECG